MSATSATRSTPQPVTSLVLAFLLGVLALHDDVRSQPVRAVVAEISESWEGDRSQNAYVHDVVGFVQGALPDRFNTAALKVLLPEELKSGRATLEMRSFDNVYLATGTLAIAGGAATTVPVTAPSFSRFERALRQYAAHDISVLVGFPVSGKPRDINIRLFPATFGGPNGNVHVWLRPSFTTTQEVRLKGKEWEAAATCRQITHPRASAFLQYCRLGIPGKASGEAILEVTRADGRSGPRTVPIQVYLAPY